MIYNRNDINIPKGDSPDLDNEKKYIEIYQKNLINSYPSLFIFLIDQSGSMNGKPINIVKESLLFFFAIFTKKFILSINWIRKLNEIYIFRGAFRIHC